MQHLIKRYASGLCVWIGSGLCFSMTSLDYVSGQCAQMLLLDYVSVLSVCLSLTNQDTTQAASRTCTIIHLNVRSRKMCHQSYFSYMCILHTRPQSRCAINMCAQVYFNAYGATARTTLISSMILSAKASIALLALLDIIGVIGLPA